MEGAGRKQGKGTIMVASETNVDSPSLSLWQRVRSMRLHALLYIAIATWSSIMTFQVWGWHVGVLLAVVPIFATAVLTLGDPVNWKDHVILALVASLLMAIFLLVLLGLPLRYYRWELLAWLFAMGITGVGAFVAAPRSCPEKIALPVHVASTVFVVLFSLVAVPGAVTTGVDGTHRHSTHWGLTKFAGGLVEEQWIVPLVGTMDGSEYHRGEFTLSAGATYGIDDPMEVSSAEWGALHGRTLLSGVSLKELPDNPRLAVLTIQGRIEMALGKRFPNVRTELYEVRFDPAPVSLRRMMTEEKSRIK